ncbi:MAG: tetratricopeptide repeat protein [Myxococcota bacterium]
MRAFALGIVVSVTLVSIGARADDAQKARTLYQAGTVHYEEGDWARALDEFQAAYRYSPKAALLYNIAQCHDKLGQLDETIDALRRYLEATPDASDRSSVEGWLRALEATKAAKQAPTPAPAPPPAPAPAAAVVEAPAAALPVDPPDADPLSHAGRLGAVAGVDVDGKGRGVVALAGATYGLGDFVEVGLTALLGGHQGLEPSVTALLLRGAWKPTIAVGAPTFFVDGARAGVHGTLGVQWDPVDTHGVFLGVGVMRFFSAPANFDETILVPTLGVQGRL